ncbi:MAG: hypothetical protein JSV86_12500 [Gemmatimonadota bacterium]|nr:MAG: hypothetical protein JSV86_12500 [Gemmatimonadota bacterium]
MSDESTVGRVTPYEVVFGEARFAEQEFPAIAEEAKRRGVSVWRYDRFTLLERVSALLAEVLLEEAGPAAVDQHLQILYHAYHFWCAGCSLYAFEAPVVRSLIESAPDLGGWSFRIPQPSLYVELPKNLFWAQVTEDEPPEPVDGMFVAREPDQPIAELELLIVLGIRSERPGFSVAGLRLEPGRARELDEAAAFQSNIPGADLAGLYSLQRYSEAAVLALRTLWYIDACPAACERVRGGGVPEFPGHGGPTALDHVRVSLIEGSCQ